MILELMASVTYINFLSPVASLISSDITTASLALFLDETRKKMVERAQDIVGTPFLLICLFDTGCTDG